MVRRLQMLLLGLALVGLCVPVSLAQEDANINDEAAAEVNEEKVVVLTAANFDTVTSASPYTLVEFYAPWCGHCQELTPHYANAALTLAESHPNVVLAKVDATEESSLAERFGVDGFPTLKWLYSGSEIDYSGGRTAEGIVKWVTKMTGPPTRVVSTVEELKAAEAATDALVVGYFATDTLETDPALAAFIEVARQDINDAFLQTSDAAVAAAAGAVLGSFSVVSNFKPELKRVTVPYSGAMEAEAIEEFVRYEVIPSVVPFSTDTTEIIFGSGIDNHLIFVGSAADLSLSAAPFKAFHSVAQKLRKDHTFIFVTVDSDSREAQPVTEFFELEEVAKPVLIGFEMEPGQRKFAFDGTLTEGDIESFAVGILDGSVKPHLKSDPIPEEDTDGHVKIVVGTTLEDVVMDPTKDVLLEVYAPWCGHCKQLEPIYKKLAARFKDIESVVVAKMDGTSNEHPDVEVEGYPTILFFPAKENAEAIDFDGDRTLKALTKFIKEHAVIPYELKKKADVDADTDADTKDEL